MMHNNVTSINMIYNNIICRTRLNKYVLNVDCRYLNYYFLNKYQRKKTLNLTLCRTLYPELKLHTYYIRIIVQLKFLTIPQFLL